MVKKDSVEAELEQKLKNSELDGGTLDNKTEDTTRYNPNKRNRAIRRKVYERYYWLRDEDLRQEAEADWETADKEYGMVNDEVDIDDWRSHLELPDAFSAIQTQAQETIERRARPSVRATEECDEPIEEFSNAVLNYNMDNTGFDYQYFLAKLSASIRGTAFLMDYWRLEKRTVKDPTSVDKDGNIIYKKKEIIDFDDDYTEWVPNEYIYIDEKAKHIDEAVDMFKREILNIDVFHDCYDEKPGFYDTEYVAPGGETHTRSYFKLPKDVTEEDVEVLHYFNRMTDSYQVVANNVVICDEPLETKHKELPLTVIYQYRQPGRFWGIGIPKIIHMLTEERKSIRNLNMDRQKIIVGGAFLHNSAFDIDDEDEVLYPGKFISVDTNGQPLNQAIQPLSMGDVPVSYFRTEEILLQDERRATGIEDRLESSAASTATEAAIKKESILKRVNMISMTNEMDALVRLGRIKWSNIQFFYGTPRMNEIIGSDEGYSKEYRTVSVEGKKFSVVTENGKKQLKMEDIKGRSGLNLKPEFARYMHKNYDIIVDADIFTPVSKAIEQTKKTEMFSLMMANPATMAVMDINGATEDVLKANNIKPDKWLKNTGSNRYDQMMLAESENMVMAAGQPLNGTKDATEDHTMVHLMFAKSQEFAELSPEIKTMFMNHILEEHDNNPTTGAAADLMSAYGVEERPELIPGGLPGSQAPLPPPGIQATTDQPQAQVADLQPTNFSQPE